MQTTEEGSVKGAASETPVLGTATAPPPGDPDDDPPHIRRVIDNSFPPVLTVDSGEVVVFECPGMPLPPNATVADLDVFDPDRPHTIVGPVEVAGARPGDRLAVEILHVELAQNYGHTGMIPGFGLLGEDVERTYLHNFEWEDGAEYTELRPDVRIPLNPFCGILGVMPAEPGPHTTLPPRANGGNMDLRHLVPGTTLFLPVQVDGALFFAGDGHGAQGDGEVCVSGLETAVRATLRLSVERGRPIQEPRFLTRAPLTVDPGRHGWYGTSAVGADLYACSQNAIRYMIDYLVSERGLSWEEAFVLCSLAADLKISEIVDAPNWIVSAYLPLSVFADA